MPPDDDADDDAPASGAPLPPDDRLWRHPSELMSVGPAPAPAPVPTPVPTPASRAPGLWSIALVSGLVGAVLTVGIAAATGNLGSTTIERPVERVSARPAGAGLVSASIPAEGTTAIRARIAPALVHLDIADTKTPRSGSAVAFRDDGYLLTVVSLVGSATSATATMDDGSSLPATVIGTDTVTGIAVLKVDRTGIDTAVLDSRDAPEVGETAYALAAPSSAVRSPSVTAGLVSAVDREVTADNGAPWRGLIQTDAPLAGAGGGALTTADGVLIGLVIAPESTPGGGYAVPIATARRAADDIIATGKAQHVWLGVEADDLDAATAQSMHVAGGAVIGRVIDNSPAAAAGLQAGDTVTAVDHTPVASMSALLVELRGHEPGESVEIEYWRDGTVHTGTATLATKTS